MSDSFSINISGAVSGLLRVNREIQEAARRGMAKAGMQLLDDCVNVEPTVPWKTGHLRSSGSLFVDGELIITSPDVGGEGSPNTEDSGSKELGSIITRVGFNTPYAAKTHEVPMNFVLPGSGNKYLEAKIRNYGSQYYEIVMEVIRGAGSA